MTMWRRHARLMPGGDTVARVNVTMPDKIWQKASVVAGELGLSLSSFCVLAVSEYIKQRDAVNSLDVLREIFEKKGVSRVDV